MVIGQIDRGTYPSGAVIHGNLIFLASLTADDLFQGVAGQTEQILRKIETAWIDEDNPPARATVQAKLAGERILGEIMATAARA